MQISFIIPCHNVEEYVGKCVASIEKQQFESYEIIIVDDMSTDNTLGVIKELASKNGNIKVMQTTISKGYAGQPRNIGIDNAKGDYLAFIDPDDYYIGDNIRRSLEKYGKYDMIVNSYLTCYSTDGKLEMDRLIILEENEYDYVQHFHKAFKSICLQRVIFKKEVFANGVRFNEDLPSQDTIILFDILKTKPSVVLTNMLTTVYISDRPGSVTNTYNFAKIQKGLKAIDVINEKVWESDYSQAEKEALDRLFSSWYLSCIKPFADEQIENEIRKYKFARYYRRKDGTSL